MSPIKPLSLLPQTLSPAPPLTPEFRGFQLQQAKAQNPSPREKECRALSLARARSRVQSGIVRINHDASPTDGNGNVTPPVENTPPTPAPPAAAAVAAGKTARELDLEAELAAERERVQIESEGRKQRERDLCDLQDKHEAYRKQAESRAAKPAPKKSSWSPVIGSED